MNMRLKNAEKMPRNNETKKKRNYIFYISARNNFILFF